MTIRCPDCGAGIDRLKVEQDVVYVHDIIEVGDQFQDGIKLSPLFTVDDSRDERFRIVCENCFSVGDGRNFTNSFIADEE